jgi:hypothetical protein
MAGTTCRFPHIQAILISHDTLNVVFDMATSHALHILSASRFIHCQKPNTDPLLNFG